MLVEDEQTEEIIARVAALDIGKAEVMCCARVPGEGSSGRRLQEVRPYSTMTRSLLVMAQRLAELGVTRVVMEATSDYWKPVYYLLEAHGFEHRTDLVEARTAEQQRVEKLLEDAQIKLSVVASDSFGVSGRDMMAALVSGVRDPKVLARMARGRLRAKITQLEEAFTGYFTDHHALLLTKMLARIDGLGTDIAELESTIEEMVAPFAQVLDRLDEIPGIGTTGARVIIAEIGLDMSRFPTAAHLCSWAKFTPRIKESAGKKKGRSGTGHGNRYLAKVLGEAAAAAGKTDTFLGERYRRIAKRRGNKRAIVAVGRSILIIIWHL
ncbi:MAG: transposase, partial [Pseudonocardiaceae bacterium]